MAEQKLRLSARKAGEIRALAEAVLSGAGCKSAPVPVERVAASMGAQVLYAPYEGDDLAGMLLHHGGRHVIAVNSAHHKNRQRFTIAHECAHLALEHSVDPHVDRGFPQTINRDAKSSTATDIREVEANYFAAELLMPRRWIEADLRSGGIDLESDETIARLAKKYGVSSQAMTYRIANLMLS